MDSVTDSAAGPPFGAAPLASDPSLPADASLTSDAATGSIHDPILDEEILAARLTAARPLASSSPHPGNGSAPLRRDVLYCLRTGGPASPEQIAESVGASRTGVLQQLRTLETAGLVTRTVIRHGVGRPRHVYDLTAGAQQMFPANYGGLSQALLAALTSIGGDELVEQVFEARRQQLQARISQRLGERLPPSASLWERVREVARFQDENGYLGRATRDDSGSILLTEHNCAIYDVSGRYGSACAAEQRLLQEVIGAPMTRECHIASGGRSCTYRIEPSEG